MLSHRLLEWVTHIFREDNLQKQNSKRGRGVTNADGKQSTLTFLSKIWEHGPGFTLPKLS